MRYEFVQSSLFVAEAGELDLSLNDIREVENTIAVDPGSFPVMTGTGGVRKVRFAPEGRSGGKSGGLRVCYFYVTRASHIHLLSVFSKNEKQNLNASDKAQMRRLTSAIEAMYRRRS